MIINGIALLAAAPITEMYNHKVQAKPTSYGLTECGYDIRLLEDIHFTGKGGDHPAVSINGKMEEGYMALGSSIERFEMPNDLMGRVLNKSTWARKGLDASMTTNIEPGWRGHLTIELIYHGYDDLRIPAGSGICQVIFEKLANPAQYEGKYQDQEAGPQPARGLHLDPTIYMPPDQAFNHQKAMWDSFDTAQQRHLVQNAKAQGFTELPAWMVVRDEGPVLIVDAKGTYPENLDGFVDQQDPTKRGFSPK